MATWSKLFTNFAWKNRPDTSTPLGQTLLNRLNNAINGIDDRVVTLNAEKASTEDLNGSVVNVRLDEKTGIFTFTRFDGTTFTINTALEEVVTNFVYDYVTQSLVLTLADGTTQNIDLSALITQYEFTSSATILFTVGTDGKVTANVKPNSIADKMLQTNYLADITTQANTAVSASQSALESQSLAEQHAEEADAQADRAKAEADRAEEAAEKAEAVTGITVDTTLDTSSFNPIANKAVAEAFKNVDAKTLDGHEAEYFVEKVKETLSTSILEKALTLSNGMHNFVLAGGGNYSGNDLPNEAYSYGNATVEKRGIEATVLLWGRKGSPMAVNYYNGEWSGWGILSTLADLAKYLPLTGGYLSGNLYLKSDKAEQLVAYLQNSLRRGGLMLTADGSLNFYDYTNGKNIINSTVNGTNTFNGTASGNLPLSGGGTVKKANAIPVMLDNTSSGANACYLAFLAEGAVLGTIGMRNGKPVCVEQGQSDAKIIIHEGNITDYVAADSETGTFTLKLNGVTLGTGTYYKVGKMVHCRATGNLPQVVDKGYASLTGFPFANASLNGSTVDFHVHQYYGKASDNLVFNVGASEITLDVPATIGQNQPFNFSTIYFTA